MIVTLINTLYYILVILIFARFVLSWVRPDPYHPVLGPLTRFVYQATEPLMAPIRRVLPATGGLDLSPMILLLGLALLRNVIIGLLI